MRRAVRVLRGGLSGLFFVLFGAMAVVALPVFPLLAPVSRRLVRALVRLFFRFFVAALGATGLVRLRLGPDARRTLRACRGKVVVMNHPSLLDVVALIALLGDSVCVVKAAATRNPFMLAAVRTVYLPNDGDPAATVAAAVRHLAAGVNLVVFPEGTRTPAGARLGPLRRGAARIALAARADVLPLRLDVDPPVLAKRQPWWDVGDRIIWYNLRVREAIRAAGDPDHRHAVALTEQIRKDIS